MTINLNKVCNIEDFEAMGLEKPYRRKHWEVAMAVSALNPLAKDGAEILGVGAGSEQTIFHLLNTGARVWATDLYADPGGWHNYASATMMTSPEKHAPAGADLSRLVVQHMDMRHLRFPDDSFNGVFSSGSIEHVGTLDDVARAAAEIGRVLKPGGVATLATEFRVGGTVGQGWQGVILFDEAMIEQYIVKPSGLIRTSKADYGVNEATISTAFPLEKFVHAFDKGIQIKDDDVVLTHNGYLFTSVQITLRKPERRSKAN